MRIFGFDVRTLPLAFLRLKLPTTAEVERREHERTTALVERFSRGNINLKRGRYATYDDIAARRLRLSKYAFK